ncbi:reductase [Lactobacillus corticis]|uniref:RibT protein n=1 Tax=Lactobacillus corticis TaxID=2201249 RepID=A0A916VHS5_9LACO|nr:reductase [Lactobacillus corticis]GFZ26972.1 RibT protein [Lactobacillus corticis]
MLIPYKQDLEKTVMGLLSYLPDLKNIDNLKSEMALINGNNDFELYVYQASDGNKVGVIGVQTSDQFVVIRYLSLLPAYRDDKHRQIVVNELEQEKNGLRISAVPDYTYLLKFVNKNNE